MCEVLGSGPPDHRGQPGAVCVSLKWRIDSNLFRYKLTARRVIGMVGMGRRPGETALYTATARREGEFWEITVNGLPRTRTHVWKLPQAEPMIHRAIACALDVPDRTFDVRVEVDDPIA